MSESTYPSVKDLTLEEKASLTSGGDAWHLRGVESKGIPGYMITDGPHGLRKSLASSAGETDLDDSVPATCFPPAAGCLALGILSSFTRLVRRWLRSAFKKRWL